MANNIDAEAEYLKAVEEGKAITASMSGKQWVLGDLAATVEKDYGKNRLAQYATDINFPGAVCTLERCRDVCHAFPQNRVRPRFFASAKLLAAHPERLAIVENNPDISKAEAREIMHKWRAEQSGSATSTEADKDDDLLDEEDTAPTSAATELTSAPTSAATESTSAPTSAATASTPARAKGAKKTDSEEQAKLKETKRWFNSVVDLANAAVEKTKVMECKPDERARLAVVIEPRLVKEIEKGGEALVALADWFTKLVAEASDELIAAGQVNTAPKRHTPLSQCR